MRRLLALAVLAGATLATAQEAKKPADADATRFGVVLRLKNYPQATPKQALESVIAAADNRDFGYVVSHLLDPAFVDARLADRARQFEPAVEIELARQRDFQKANPDGVTPETRVPVDTDQFRARVAADARSASFRQLVRDVQEKLSDDPSSLKDLRRFNRDGAFPDAAAGGDTARVGLPDVKDRAVFLKKVGDRWFVENRQADEKAPEPKKE